MSELLQDEQAQRILDHALYLQGPARLQYLQQACLGDDAQLEDLLWLIDGIEQMQEQQWSKSLINTTTDERTIGPYTIVRELGRGGQGVVYEAMQANPARRVALKVLSRPAVGRQYERDVFRREVRMLARLQHPGIATLYQAGQTEDGRQYYSMELIEGESLHAYVATRQLDTTTKLMLFIELCEAIQFAHLRGVMHHDIKPSNVLVDRCGRIKVLDFGLAQLIDPSSEQSALITEQGVHGTLAYMSPEQVKNRRHEIDTRSDVYALGVVLYEMLTGQKPHDLSNSSLADAVVTISEAVPLSLRRHNERIARDIDVIAHKALSKERSHRYQSVSELQHDIQAYMQHKPITARPSGIIYKIRLFFKRHPAISGLSLLVVMMMAALALRSYDSYQRDQHSRQRLESALTLMGDLLVATDGSTFKPKQKLEALLSASEHIEREYSDSPKMQALLFDKLGTACLNSGPFVHAVSMFERALALQRGIDDTIPEHIAVTLSHLGTAWSRSPEPEHRLVAKEYFGQAISMFENSKGHADDHLDALLGYACVILDEDPHLAQRVLEAAVEIVQTHYGENDGRLLKLYGLLSNSLRQQGKEQEASTYLARLVSLDGEAMFMHTVPGVRNTIHEPNTSPPQAAILESTAQPTSHTEHN